MVKLENDWDEILKDEFKKDYYARLHNFLKEEYNSRTIYPPMNNIFEAFKLTSYQNTKVVIIGQDPYHEEGQAHGLAFSVQKGIKVPPSLVNIYKEIESDIGIKMDFNSGYLQNWAKQGVLLLNNVLTVRQSLANSHKNKGWETFTDDVVKLLNEKETPVVFVFWGNNAKSKMKLITNPKHLILTAPHPSPLSAYTGFFGCKHFSKINEFLMKTNQKPIDWKN